MRVRFKMLFRATQLLALAALLSVSAFVRADQQALSDGVAGDGHFEIRGDQYGAFGPFSVTDPGYGNYNPDGPLGLRPWAYWSGLMLTDGVEWQWLMDADDWPGDFGGRMMDDEVISDESTGSTRTSSFNVSLYGDLRVDLVQELSKYNIVQTYTFNNLGNSLLEMKALWETDVDMEFAQARWTTWPASCWATIHACTLSKSRMYRARATRVSPIVIGAFPSSRTPVTTSRSKAPCRYAHPWDPAEARTCIIMLRG